MAGPRDSWPSSQASSRFGAHTLHGVRLLVGVTLFLPRVGMQVIAVDLPETRSVDVEELEGPDPLGAFPEVELRDDEPARASVLGRQIPAVVLDGQKSVLGVELR